MPEKRLKLLNQFSGPEREALEGKIKKRQALSDELFFIKRIPINTLREFKGWCREELANDYGMGLKWLWDFYRENLPLPESQVKSLLADLNDRLVQVENKSDEENTIRFGDGKNVEVKRK